jgi:hypothetical protein
VFPEPEERRGFSRMVHSYRWRRRFAITAIVCGIAGPLIWLGVAHETRASSTAAQGPNVPLPSYYQQPKKARFTRRNQREVQKALALFLVSAVGRKHPAASWSVAGPDLRSGMTKKEWSTGSIPVQPYPVANKGLGQWDNVEYSYRNAVGLEVLLQPKPGSGQGPVAADVDVIKNRQGRWQVNYFMPKKYHGNPIPAHTRHRVVRHHKRLSHKARQARAAKHARIPKKVAAPPNLGGPRQSNGWWALPVGLLALALFLPILVGTIVWIRNRRAYNSYGRS